MWPECFCYPDWPSTANPVYNDYCKIKWSSNSNFGCFYWNYNLSDDQDCQVFGPKPIGAWTFKHVSTWTETFTGTLNGKSTPQYNGVVPANAAITIICDEDCKGQERPTLFFSVNTTGKKASWEWRSANHPCCPMPCNADPQSCIDSGTYTFDFQIGSFALVGNSDCLNGTTFNDPRTAPTNGSAPYASAQHGYARGNSRIQNANLSPGLLDLDPKLDLCGFHPDPMTDLTCLALNRSFENDLCMYDGDPFGTGCKGYALQISHGMPGTCVQTDEVCCCNDGDFDEKNPVSVECQYPGNFVEHVVTDIVWTWGCC